VFSTVLLAIIFVTSVFHLLPVHSNMHRPHNSGFLVSPLRTLVICTSHQYYSGDQIKKMKCAGHVAHMGERQGAWRFDGEPYGKETTV